MRPQELQRLGAHAARLASTRIDTLHAADATRFQRFSLRVGPLLLDYSKNLLDSDALDALGALTENHALPAAIVDLFAGAVVNRSERRAALHTALRQTSTAESGEKSAQELRPAIATSLAQMQALVAEVHAGDSAHGITDVINVGIGGSDLGPRLACAALGDFDAGKVRVHFLANVDGGATAHLMQRLDPRRTLVCLVSKSFGTQETLLNGRVLRDWLAAAHGGAGRALAQHLVAVSANVRAAAEFGVAPERVLPMWDVVGGRYSVWSAVGLSVALKIGMDGFRQFLAGAAAMDAHFRQAPWSQNLPVLLALVGIWNRNALGLPTHAVIPYDDRLGDLPAYLQQLEMESNGKAVGADGLAVAQATAPVLWGHVGSNAQHAFFQALHQGTDVVPVDFIGVVKPAHDLVDNHRALLANLLAQSAALMRGRSTEVAYAELASAGLDEAARRSLAAQRTFPGNRPSNTLLLDELTPYNLGALLASYEHKVFVQGRLWGVNSFDQWGVELGKQIAQRIEASMSDGAMADDFDGSTRGLLGAIGR